MNNFQARLLLCLSSLASVFCFGEWLSCPHNGLFVMQQDKCRTLKNLDNAPRLNYVDDNFFVFINLIKIFLISNVIDLEKRQIEA